MPIDDDDDDDDDDVSDDEDIQEYERRLRQFKSQGFKDEMGSDLEDEDRGDGMIMYTYYVFAHVKYLKLQRGV